MSFSASSLTSIGFTEVLADEGLQLFEDLVLFAARDTRIVLRGELRHREEAGDAFETDDEAALVGLEDLHRERIAGAHEFAEAFPGLLAVGALSESSSSLNSLSSSTTVASTSSPGVRWRFRSSSGPRTRPTARPLRSMRTSLRPTR